MRKVSSLTAAILLAACIPALAASSSGTLDLTYSLTGPSVDDWFQTHLMDAYTEATGAPNQSVTSADQSTATSSSDVASATAAASKQELHVAGSTVGQPDLVYEAAASNDILTIATHGFLIAPGATLAVYGQYDLLAAAADNCLPVRCENATAGASMSLVPLQSGLSVDSDYADVSAGHQAGATSASRSGLLSVTFTNETSNLMDVELEAMVQAWGATASAVPQVPEPSTFGALGTGLAALAWVLRRRNRKG